LLFLLSHPASPFIMGFDNYILDLETLNLARLATNLESSRSHSEDHKGVGMKPILIRTCLFAPLAISGLWLFGLGLAAAKVNKKEQARALLDRAKELSNIRATGSPGFRMKVKLRLLQKNGIFMEGSYLLIWATPQKWREEISFPGYNEILVATQDGTWSVNNQEYRPYVVSRLINSLRVGLGWPKDSKDKIAKVREIEIDGIRMTCAELNPEQQPKNEYCADSLTGTLIRDTDGYSQIVYKYGDNGSLGDRKFPRTILIFQGDVLMADGRVEELTLEPNPEPELFTAPSGENVRFQPNCEGKKIVTARLILHPNPRYPANALHNRVSGIVRLYAVIGTDGRPHALTVVNSAGPELDAAALDVVHTWRYQPTTCDGIPVDVETLIVVNFSLQ